MTENEIIIATLKAQIIIEETRAAVLRQWVLNLDLNLQADACEKTASRLKLKVTKLQNEGK